MFGKLTEILKSHDRTHMKEKLKNLGVGCRSILTEVCRLKI